MTKFTGQIPPVLAELKSKYSRYEASVPDSTPFNLTRSMITKMGLGTVQFGMRYGISNTSGQTPEPEVAAILNEAHEQGIDLLDTASGYGASEAVLGRHHAGWFWIVSKWRANPDQGSLRGQLDESLNALNICRLYGYLAHRPLEVVNHPPYWEEMSQFEREGLVERIGFSFNEPAELEAVLANGFTPGLVQLPFNYLDRRFLPYLKTLHELGCEIHARSPFLQGLLLMDPDGWPPYFNELKPIGSQLQSCGEQLPGLLLSYVAKNPYIDRVIFGVNNRVQLREILRQPEDGRELPEIANLPDERMIIPSLWPK